MSIDLIDGIVFASFAIVVLAVVMRRRAGVGVIDRSSLPENIVKGVIVVVGIGLIATIMLLRYRRD
jgi:hypothetical protein